MRKINFFLEITITFYFTSALRMPAFNHLKILINENKPSTLFYGFNFIKKL